MQRATLNTAGVFLFVCLVLSLQAQITVFGTPDYSGLRLSLADLFVPLGLAFAGFSLWKNKSLLPAWNVPRPFFWLGSLFVILLLASLNFYVLQGHWSLWALLNKTVGWLILII